MSLKEKCKQTFLQKVLEDKGYVFFTNGQYNLNIIGVRKSGDEVTNSFDDVIVVTYKDSSDEWKVDVYDATTDPGKSSMTSPSNSKGCAILVPDQYKSAYKIGYHKGQYRALVQSKPVKVYRDNNKDKIYDFDPETIDEGDFGINIHKAGTDSTLVDGWSAGCQVFKKASDFNEFMNTCDKQVSNGMGSTFTYTLLKEEDLG